MFSGLALPVWSQELPSVYLELEKQYNDNQFNACIRLEKQIETFAHSRVDTLAANSFFYMGDAYNQVGNTKIALSYFERGKSILLSLGLRNTPDFSHTLNNLAYLYLQDGDYTRAGTAADELIEHDRKFFSPTAPEFVESVLYATDIYIQLDRLRDAEQLLSNSLKPQAKNSLNRGLLLNKLGDLSSYTGQYSRAMRSLTDALDIHWELAGEESPEYTTAAINLGILYMNQGKYPEAEEIFEVALSKLAPSEPAYASVLNNQALVFQSLGQMERAEKTLLEIKKIDSIEVGTTHPDYAITLSNLGLVFADLEKYREAELALTQALSIQKSNREGNTLSYARTLNNLAKIHQMAGFPENAVPLLERSLTIFKKMMGKESPEYATSAYNLGLALWQAGKDESGIRYLKESAIVRKKVLGKHHPKYAESLLKIGEYNWYKKDIRNARQSFGEVFDNFYFQIDETFPVLTEEEKSKFYYTNIRGAFDKFNCFAIEHQKESPVLINEVYNYLINTKAAIMFATEKVKSSIRTSGDTMLIRQFELWQAGKEEIAKLYSLNEKHPQLDSLLENAHLLEKELARRSAAFESQFVRRKYNRNEIQNALKPGEAAVEVLRYKNYSPQAGGNFTDEIKYAFLVVTTETKDQPALIRLSNGNDLETKYLKFYHNSIRFHLDDQVSYQLYFEPLAEYLKKENITRIFFSPDGVYNQININTVQNPGNKKFLIDEFDIRLVTNTRELVESGSVRKNERSSILIGYPKFNLEDAELNSTAGNRITPGGNNRTWRGGLQRYMRADEGISVLPGTEVEIEKIAKLFGETTSVYTEEQASERRAKSVMNPKVLHIATHGYFLEDALGQENSSATYFSSPLLNAGLIMAGAENFLKTGEPINKEGDDGILTAFEAMNLELDDTRLVVLSACETALGDIKNGEGVYGLQRAFKLAGAQSIVMSLWNVDDEATQELMSSFYEEMLQSGDQHLAFRIAQQKVREKYPSPFYWGAFIMVGI